MIPKPNKLLLLKAKGGEVLYKAKNKQKGINLKRSAEAEKVADE